MIIVYYDSAVQTAFEDLVKFVSQSRNAMRKGKMAAKMAEMRKAAEKEVEDEEQGTADEEKVGDEPAMPRLQYRSSRQAGLGANAPKDRGSGMPVGMLRGYRRSGGLGGGPDVFDELDKSLEWCQSQCEKAAHQFLREGECGTEINNIKTKLLEVKAGAEKETEKLRKLEAVNTPKRAPTDRARSLKRTQARTPSTQIEIEKSTEAESMEVDDGLDDQEPPPTLIFKRSRDV